jgi:hypothetical protein
MRRVPKPLRSFHFCLRVSRAIFSVAALILIASCLASTRVTAQALQEVVGQIEGADIAVKSPLSMEAANGRIIATLASGSEITVRSGEAHLTLADGGELDVCGPAHFSTLKASGAVTLALDYGRIQARLAGAGGFSVFTPLVVAAPVAIGDAPRELTLGLDAKGEMCIVATRGAVRITPQLTGQSLLVPQGGQIQLEGGELQSVRADSAPCGCESFDARKQKPPELSMLASPGAAPASRPAAKLDPPVKPTPAKEPDPPPIVTDPPTLPGKAGPPATEEPIYKVLMPPLTFDATSPAAPPDPDPQTILLLRSVRVRPSVVFRGRVAPAAPEKAAPSVQVAQVIAPRADDPARNDPGVFSRMWDAVRRTFSSSRGPCAGVGCSK